MDIQSLPNLLIWNKMLSYTDRRGYLTNNKLDPLLRVASKSKKGYYKKKFFTIYYKENTTNNLQELQKYYATRKNGSFID